MKTLDVDLVKSLLDYDPNTGIFTWKVTRTFTAKPGSIAGHLTTAGYVHVRIAGRRIYAHRLAWFYIHGRWPKKEIDHIDNNKSNNMISNLREADNCQNHANVNWYSSNSSGIKGVRKFGKKFRATLGVKGKILHLGTFETPQEAHAEYIKAAQQYFGEFANAGKAV